MGSTPVSQGGAHPSTSHHTKPSLDSLPDDAILKIISYLPQLPVVLGNRHLKEAYELLSLARTQNRCAFLCHELAEHVCTIDPFRFISPLEELAHLPPYANPTFLRLLVHLSENLISLRAPNLRGVIQHAGKRLQFLEFIDRGLTNLDLEFIRNSRLALVDVSYPTRDLLEALGNVTTLEAAILRRISEPTIPYVIEFFNRTTVRGLTIELDTSSDDALRRILHKLPSLHKFVLHCARRQFWWVLRCMRSVAVKVGQTEVVVGGVRIEILRLDAPNEDSAEWLISTMRRLFFRTDLGSNELSRYWKSDMSIQGIDLEILEEAAKHGVRDEDIDRLINNSTALGEYRDDETSELTVHFGRTIPSFSLATARAHRIIRTGLHLYTSRVVVSQDMILLAANQDDEDLDTTCMPKILDSFVNLRVVHLCRPSAERKLSARFLIGLPKFLKALMEVCPRLECVYLENAGELFLQKIGLPVFSDKGRLKELIMSVIEQIDKIVTDYKVEMGTVIAQLVVWARMSEFRVAHRRDLDNGIHRLVKNNPDNDNPDDDYPDDDNADYLVPGLVIFRNSTSDMEDNLSISTGSISG